jgi:hypothetical protein
MIGRFKKIVFLCFIMCFNMPAIAGLITETWQGEVTDTNTDLIGVLMSWTVTYDESSMMAGGYLDGPDGTAGTIDDVVDWEYDLSCPTGDGCGQGLGFANAIFDFGEIFGALSSQVPVGYSWSDAEENYNEATVWTNNDGTKYYFYRRENFRYESNDFQGNAKAEFHSYQQVGQGLRANVSYLRFSPPTLLSVKNTIIKEVPEPTTLAILALGLMGLASRQFSKQS